MATMDMMGHTNEGLRLVALSADLETVLVQLAHLMGGGYNRPSVADLPGDQQGNTWKVGLDRLQSFLAEIVHEAGTLSAARTIPNIIVTKIISIEGVNRVEQDAKGLPVVSLEMTTTDHSDMPPTQPIRGIQIKDGR